MDRIEVIARMKKPRNDRLPFVTLILLLAGVFGMLLFLGVLDGVVYGMELVLPVAAAFCFGMWFCYPRHRKGFYLLLLFAAVTCVALAAIQWSALSGQVAHIKDSLSGEAELETVSVTAFALLFAVVWSTALFFLEHLVKSHTLLYLLTTIFLLLSPLFGVRMGVATAFLLLLFGAAFWTVQIAARRGNAGLFASVGFHRAGKAGIAITLALVMAFSIALPLVDAFSLRFFQSVYDVESFTVRSMKKLTGQASRPITGGKISSGNNNFQTGAVHLTITASRQPTETLYLRGFGGGEYIGGDWIRSSDEALFENIIREDGWPNEYGRIGSLYYSMYPVMNGYMVKEEPAEPIFLLIRHSNHEYGNAYVPYYSQRGWSYGAWGIGSEREGYQYRYYEQKDMDIDWENVSEEFEEQRDIYKQLQEKYIAQIQEAYTQVPTEILPRLTALAEENLLTDLDEITAFILYTLHSNAAYSLTPGWSVFNQDIAEYFLFERKEGFCEHFALAATLLYRLYGIPARYATGYMVSPSDFQEQEDGSYLAAVTDGSAHAWAEIFLEDYGWTPVEVTPAGDGSTIVSYPGFDGIQLAKLWEERGWDVSVPSLDRNENTGRSRTAGIEQWELLPRIQIDFEKYRDLFLVLFTCLCYTLLLMPLFLDHRRLRRMQEMETMNCRQLFYRLMETIHFGGILSEYDGSETDFPTALSEAVPSIRPNEAERLMAAVNEAAFGSTPTNEEETGFVRTLCRRAAADIYTNLPRNKKLLFRYWKALG